jgi:hypothetical protein
MTKEEMAELGRKAAAQSKSGRTYLGVDEVQNKDYEWCFKFNPDMFEVSVRSKHFGDDPERISR